MIEELLGWIGSVFIIIAYALTLKKGDTHQYLCNYLNLIGACFVAYNCYKNMAFPSLALNIIWMGIAALGILKNYKKH